MRRSTYSASCNLAGFTMSLGGECVNGLCLSGRLAEDFAALPLATSVRTHATDAAGGAA